MDGSIGEVRLVRQVLLIPRGGLLRPRKTPYEPFPLLRGKYPEGGMGVEISLPKIRFGNIILFPENK